MKDKICSNCRYFRVSVSPRIGECLCLPPSERGFPAVSHHDFCGRYEEKAADTSDPKDPPIFGLPNKA